MYNVCPDTNPDILGLNEVRALYLGADNITAADCPARLSSYDCVAHGFNASGSYGTNASSWANSPLPHTATGSLTDKAGIITSPVSGATYTWTALNATYTVTAASVEAMATKTASAASTASGSGTSTASASKGSSSSSAGQKLNLEQRSVVAFAGFAGVALALF